jgi:hypothetical protein
MRKHLKIGEILMNQCRYCKNYDNLGLCILTNDYKNQRDVCDKFNLDTNEGKEVNNGK